MMDEFEDPSKHFLDSSRFWIQRVFVPLMVCLGVGGNTITVMVLTRRRMRCSTNVYLTALAMADIVYLLFVFVLSFEHYENIHERKFALYWRFYGIAHWLTDAASSTSVWLTVSFTLERYIAVCHPIKGKVLCTESRAKNIIVVVVILCILLTASTSFEYQLAVDEHCPFRNCTADELAKVQRSSESDDDNRGGVSRKLMAQNSSVTNQDDLVFENGTCCTKRFTVDIEHTTLGNNGTYRIIMYWVAAICFWLVPLVLIATFNCFLVHAVYNSQKRRRKMTNNQENVSLSNENRITIMLIGVVVLFLVCQTPTGTFMIYENFSSNKDETSNNIKRGLGNLFNFLVTVNAACNFLLYCVLSRKFRTTFRSLFCDRIKKNGRQDTLALSSTRTRSTNRFSNAYKNGFKRNVSEYRTPRNLETQSLTAIPRSKSLMVRAPGKAKSSDMNF